MIKKKEILFIKNNLFKLILKIDFYDNDFHWIMKNDKLDIKMESIDKNIDNARNEFAETFMIFLQELIKKNKWKEYFNHYGIKNKPIKDKDTLKDLREEILDFEDTKKFNGSTYAWNNDDNMVYE